MDSDKGSRPSPGSLKSGGAQHERLGRYRILGELGRGGMGIVLLGEDPDLEREVAIKTLPRDLADDPESFARFQREARLLAALNHPNVATIHSLETIDGTPVLTMERIRGETLAARLRTGALATEDTLRVGTKIARAIEAAHDRGVIHRDLKPGNVMVRDDGEVKVLDFGLAKELSRAPVAGVADAADADAIDSDTTQYVAAIDPDHSDDPDSETRVHSTGTDTSRSGTIGYMSPEQILGLPVDERTDLFAFGCVLFECATGSRAFTGDTQTSRAQATIEEMPRIERLPELLPAPVRDAIQRCLAKQPDGRPASARDVRKIFEDSLERFLFSQRSESLVSAKFETADVCPHNLPHALTSFIGRSRELRDIRERLAQAALVTLTGAGGSGKTRLAIEAARSSLGAGWPGGIWLIELAPLTNPLLLEKTVMNAIGVAERTDRTARECIIDHFGGARALLILDNCEHLLDAAASLVHALLARCAGLRVLATSREPLGLAGEARYLVPPLSSAELSVDQPLEELRESEAVRFFVERARQVRPEFELTSAVLPAVVGICRRLDGLPLALELAASRVRALDPAALLARLDDRFRILTGGSREKLPHHRTLLASIEWSHDQLSETERVLFRRLGVFVGGFTLQSVEAVCVDARLESWDVLDGIGSLIDKSMIEPAPRRDEEPDAAPRYRMLETFREYANQQARAAGEADATRERFARYWNEESRRAVELLTGPDAKSALARLDLELGNIREAIRIALAEVADPEIALSFTGSLTGYWMRRAHWSEGIEFLGRALEQPGAEAPTRGRASALNSSGVMKYLTGRYEEAINYLLPAIDLFVQHGRRKEAAFARMNLGNTYAFHGQQEEALREHEAVLAIAREIGETWLVGAALVNICNASEALADFDRVESAALEAVELLERLGDRSNLVMARNYVGAVAFRRGRYPEAFAIFEKNIETATELGDGYHVGHQRLHRGLCLLSLGRDAEATEDFWIALETGHEYDEPNLFASSLEAFAQRAGEEGEPAQAATLLGVADRMREERSSPQRKANLDSQERFRSELRAALGPEEFARQLDAGRVMTPEQMIDRLRAARNELSP